MNKCYRLPKTANTFTQDDVLHFLAAELRTTPEKAVKRVIRASRLPRRTFKMHGEIIARSKSNGLHSFKLCDERKIQDGNMFQSGMVVIVYEKSKKFRLNYVARRMRGIAMKQC